jgi:hypothetical protein
VHAERSLGLAEEDHGGGIQRLDLARAQQRGDGPSHDLDHPLHDAQVVEQPDERSEEDDHGQHLEREDRLLLVGHELSEQEVDAVVGVLDQRRDHVRRRSRPRLLETRKGHRQDAHQAEQSAEVAHLGGVRPKC